MPAKSEGGYDTPHVDRSYDDLDRWRFATELADIVKNTPRNWSVRIGVLGKWGEGKTTVLGFIKQLAESDGHLVIWFNPWAAATANDLWMEFANRLLRAMEAQGIRLKGQGRTKLKLFGYKAQKFLQPVERLAEFNAIAKAGIGAGLSVVRQLLSISSEQLQQLRQKLGDEKRVVVITDDLDRTDPKLIPQLLLSLRDFLDLPGFAFILGFDDTIVGRALAAHHPAWTEGGSDFLEKILDFRFPLPPVSELQRRRLFDREMRALCPFADLDAIKEIEDLLPTNPRRLKALIRNIAAMRGEIERHDQDEFNWVEVVIAQMMKLESSLFLSHFLEGEIVENETGLGYAVQQHIRRERRAGREDGAKDGNDKMPEYLKNWGISDPVVQQRLLKLVEALRARGRNSFRYHAQLATRPHLITWKEFRQLLADWILAHRQVTIQAWLQVQAERRSASVDELAIDLCTTACAYRDLRLAAAADADTLESHEGEMTAASQALALIDALAVDDAALMRPLLRNPELFNRLLAAALSWIHFDGNPSDRTARREEKDILLKFSRSIGERSDEYLERLSPWSSEWEMGNFDQHSAELKSALRAELTAVLSARVAEATLGLFSLRDGIARLREKGRFLSFKFFLSHKSTPLRAEPLRSRLFVIFGDAGGNAVIHKNCLDLFEFLVGAARRGTDISTPDECREFLRDSGYSSRLWNAVVSRQIQYRMQLHILEARQELINSGVPEALLAIPGWLADRLGDPRGR